MAACAPYAKTDLQRDIDAGWQSIAAASVDDTLRAKNWQSCLEFCSNARCDPYLQQASKASSRTSSSVSLHGSGVGTSAKDIKSRLRPPETALCHVAQTIVLAGYADLRRSYGSTELDLPFSRLLKNYKCEDPAPKPQLALPARAIRCGVEHYRAKNTPGASALADLLTIAFFFLLPPGEYAMPTWRTKTRTVQFRRQDVRFFFNGQVVPHTVPLATLLQADSVRLYIDNQKNGERGSTMHHTATGDPFCPVQALANRVHALYSVAPLNDGLSISFVPNGDHVTATDVTRAVRESVVLGGLLNSGYSPTRVSAHSLRASGAMALKLNGVDGDLIMKMGRWSSTTWLTYIHSQISSLTAGLSERMTIHHVFYNVGS
jgi:integrase